MIEVFFNLTSKVFIMK